MVRYLTYRDEQLPIRLSYRVFKGLKQDLKSIEMPKTENDAADMDPEMMETMLWHGLKSGFSAERKTFELKREDMEDILDECMIDFLTMIPEFFPKAKLGNVLKNLPAQNHSKEKETPQAIEGSAV